MSTPDPLLEAAQEPQVKEAARHALEPAAEAPAAPVEPETNGAHVDQPAETNGIHAEQPAECVKIVQPVHVNQEQGHWMQKETLDVPEDGAPEDTVAVGVEQTNLTVSDASPGSFGAPTAGEDPFASMSSPADAFGQHVKQHQTDPVFSEPVNEHVPKDVAEPVDTTAPPPQDNTSTLFGSNAPSEFDDVSAPFSTLSLDVQATEQITETRVVDLGSPMKDPSSLFGESAPGSYDFFSSLAAPAEDPFEKVHEHEAFPQQQQDNDHFVQVQTQGTDPFAHTQTGGDEQYYQQQQGDATHATPLDQAEQQHAYKEQTPNIVNAHDLFAATAAAQEEPFAQPQQTDMQAHKHAEPPADANALFGETTAGGDPFVGFSSDASMLFCSTPAPGHDPFAHGAAAQDGASAFDPFQTCQHNHAEQEHQEASSLFGDEPKDTSSLFGGQTQDASSLFFAPPSAAHDGDVSNLFGPPSAMPDIFGAGGDAFGGIGANHEASFFDSLAANHASAPGPAFDYSHEQQQQQNQQYYGYEQPVHTFDAQNYSQPAVQDYSQPVTPNYGKPAAQDYSQPAAQDYGQPAAQDYRQPAAQDYGQAQAYSQPLPAAQPGPWDGQAPAEDDPFAQIGQQQQQQHQYGGEAYGSYYGMMPQQETNHARPYYEQSVAASVAQQYDTDAQQAQPYGQPTNYQQDAHHDPFAQIAPQQDQQQDVLQQGVAAAFAQGAFAQGAFQRSEDDTDSIQNAPSEVSQPDELPFPWAAHVDPGSGCIYYFNTETGVSSWEPPVREETAEVPAQDWLSETPSRQLNYDEQQQHTQYTQHDPAQQHQQQAQNYGQADHLQPQQQQEIQHNYGQAHQHAQYYGLADQKQANDHGQAGQGAYNYGQAQPTAYEQPQAAHNYGQADVSGYAQQPQQDPYNQQYTSVYTDPQQQQQHQQQQKQEQPSSVANGRGGYTGKIFVPGAAGSAWSAQSYGQAPAQNYTAQGPQAMHGGASPMHGAAHTLSDMAVAARRPPCAVMCFGMGGQLLVAMPGNRRSVGVFTGNAQELDSNRPMRPPPVSVYKMQSMPSQAPLYRQLEAFPGPLTNSAASKKAVRAYIEEQVQNPTNADEDLSMNPGTMRLLWEVLGIMVDCNGDLSTAGETSKTIGNERIVQLLKDPNFAGDQFLNGGGATGFNAMGGMGGMGMMGGVMDPANRLMPAAPVNDVQVQQALQDMQELLLTGKREEACQKALENELWAPALLLSSYMNMEMYQKVMGEFAKRSFKVGTPLRTLYMLFAGEGKHLFDADTLDPLLDAWQANLSVLLNNRTPGDTDVVVNIGEGLWNLRKDVEAAHVCMMLAGQEVEPATSPTCRMALIGADHRGNPTNFWTAAAIQRTEIWEYAAKLKAPKKELPVVLAYKLQYAIMLAESGSKEKALEYIECLSSASQNARAGSLPPRLQVEIEMFEHRLRVHLGGKAAAGSSAFKGSFFGGLRKVLDTAVSSAIYGATPSGGVPGGMAAAVPPAPPAQAPSEKVKSIQATAAEKDRQAKFKAQQDLEKKREAEDKKRADKEAKEAAKKKASKDKGGGDKDGGGEDDEKKGMFAKLWGAVAGEKQVDLGDENLMYFSEELQRWVERGKENEVSHLHGVVLRSVFGMDLYTSSFLCFFYVSVMVLLLQILWGCPWCVAVVS